MSLAEQQWCPTSVQVTVLQARGLRTKGKSGTNDAYALMQVGKEKYQTSVAEKSVAPVWKEEATFDLPPAGGGGGGGGGKGDRSTLRVHVLHRALVGPDKQLGQADIDLPLLSEDKTRNKTEWFKLLDKNGKADKDRGEVLVDIQFMRNNMTASMFDLSAAGKSRSRLGKFKDKVRGKKKETDAGAAPGAVVPSFTQVMTDSEEEAGEEEEDEGGAAAAAGKDEKKKKRKMKSLFSSKSNLQRNMSQSMTVLPSKTSSLSRSQSSGLNVESSEGKKKFKFMIHKRSGSSGGKDSSSSGNQKPEQSNVCINGSHVYCEEPQSRSSRIASNFSLTSSGHGSMDDVPESSTPSVDSLRGVTQYSPWTEEEEEEEEAKIENIREDEELKLKGEEMLTMEKRVREEEVLEEKLAEEKRKREEEEEERARREAEEEERKRVEEEEKWQEEERVRMEEEKGRQEVEERRWEEERRAEEERVRREEEERRRQEEEERRLVEEKRAAEERVRREEEEKRRQEEEERRVVEERRAEEERVRREEEEKRIQEEEERRVVEERRAEEERVRREEEERKRRKEEERRVVEGRRAEEERVRREDEESRRKQEEQERLRRREEEELEAKRRLQEEERRWKEEEDRKRKEEEKHERLREERRKLEEMERERIEAEEEVKRQEEERVRKMLEEEAEMRRLEEEEKMQRDEEERRRKEERMRHEEEERARKEKEERQLEEKRKLEEEERRREEERVRQEEQERIRIEKERRRRREEEEERAKQEMERLAEEKGQEEEEKIQREEEEKIQREAKRLRRKKLVPEAELLNKTENETRDENKSVGNKSSAEVTSTNPFDEDVVNNPYEESCRSAAESDRSSTQASNIQHRCQSDVSSAGNTDKNELISAQRDKRQAPSPPGKNIAENRGEQDVSSQHLPQSKQQSDDKGAKTASVYPQRPLVQSIPPVTQSPPSLTESEAKHGKRPAPVRPPTAEEALPPKPKRVLSPHGNVSQKHASQTKQPPVTYSLNPFDDDEEDDDALARQKSSKMTHAPPPPGAKAATPGSEIHQNTDRNHASAAAPDKGAQQASGPKVKARIPAPASVQEPQAADAQSAVEVAGLKKEAPAPPPSSRRLQPVKPLSPVESVTIVHGGECNKDSGLQEKTAMDDPAPKGPYSQLTREELISLMQKQENQLSERDKKISQLEEYIDNLLVRVIDEQPGILMSMNAIRKFV